jgi:hypothetical protein
MSSKDSLPSDDVDPPRECTSCFSFGDHMLPCGSLTSILKAHYMVEITIP